MSEESRRPNSVAALRERVAAGDVGVRGPLVMTFLITFLAAITGLILVRTLAGLGDTAARSTTLTWVNAWSTLLYVPVFAALALYVHGEDSRLRDLFSYDRDRLASDLRRGVLLAVVLLVLDAVVEYPLTRLVTAVWGSPFAATTPAKPPLSVVVLGLVGVPLAAGVVEELVYRGYALPRLAARTTKPVGIAVTALGFGLQHVALLLYASPTYAVVRGVAVTVVGVFLGWWYFRADERLVSLVVAHAVWYAVTVGAFDLVAYLAPR